MTSWWSGRRSFPSPSIKTSEVEKGLLRASANGNDEEIVSLLAKAASEGISFNINCDSSKYPAIGIPTGWKPIQRAAYRGHTDIIRRLISNGCDINASSTRVPSAVVVAARHKHLDVIIELVSSGCNLPTPDSINEDTQNDYNQLMSFIVGEGSQAVGLLHFLKARGLPVERFINNALQHGSEDVITALIEMNADLSIKSKAYNSGENMISPLSPLLALCSRKCDNDHFDIKNILNLIFKRESYCSTTTPSSLSPHSSSSSSSLSSFIPFIDLGERDENGRTCLHLLSANNNAYGLHYILNLGEREEGKGERSIIPPSVDARDHKDCTPLHLATSKEIVNILIEHGANISAIDTNGRTPLHSAIVNGIFRRTNEQIIKDIVQILIEAETEGSSSMCLMDVVDEMGFTGLMECCKEGLVEVAKLLIISGADLSPSDREYGNTCMHWAIKSRIVDMVQLLVDTGADTEALNKEGHSPIHMAKQAPPRLRALFEPHNVFIWGSHLGRGVCSPLPLNALHDMNVVKVASGDGHNFFLTDQGHLYAWGSNCHGVLGLGLRNNAVVTTPTLVDSISVRRVIDIGCGASHSLALDDTGNVFSWGLNTDGRCGHHYTSRMSINTPMQIGDLTRIYITMIACGVAHNLALSKEGNVYTFGLGVMWRLGLGDQKSVDRPTLITTGWEEHETISTIACGVAHSAAVSSTGKLYTWGMSNDGRLGHGLVGGHSSISREDSTRVRKKGRRGFKSKIRTPVDAHVPMLVQSLHNMGVTVHTIACGCAHNIILTTDGRVFGFGTNKHGELGLYGKDNPDKSLFVATPTHLNIKAKSNDSRGEIYGSKKEKEKEDNNSKNTTLIHNIRQVACGYSHTLLLNDAGSIYSFGSGEFGQLGLGEPHSTSVPSLVPLPTSAYSIAAGAKCSIAVTGPPRVVLGDAFVKALEAAACTSTHGNLSDSMFSDVLISLKSAKPNNNNNNISSNKEDRERNVCVQRAHRILLAARSPLYRKIYSSYNDIHSKEEKEKEKEKGKEKEKEKGKEKEKEKEKEEKGKGKEKKEKKEKGKKEKGKEIIIDKKDDKGIIWVDNREEGDTWGILLEYIYTDRILLGRGRGDMNKKGLREKIIDLAEKVGLPRLVSMASGSSVVGMVQESSMPQDLKWAVNNPIFSDISFIVEGRTIYAHKVLLCCRSEYFSALFRSGMKESDSKVIYVPDYEYDVYLALMTYLYTDELEVPPDTAVELMALANEHNVPRLQQKCESIVTKGVELDTVAYVWKLSIMYKTKKLKTFCESLICTHYDAVKKSDAYELLNIEERNTLDMINKSKH